MNENPKNKALYEKLTNDQQKYFYAQQKNLKES